jgi:hypothetical protein
MSFCPGSLWVPAYAPARKTERFKAYVRKVGFVDYWRARGWSEFCHPTTGDIKGTADHLGAVQQSISAGGVGQRPLNDLVFPDLSPDFSEPRRCCCFSRMLRRRCCRLSLSDGRRFLHRVDPPAEKVGPIIWPGLAPFQVTRVETPPRMDRAECPSWSKRTVKPHRSSASL